MTIHESLKEILQEYDGLFYIQRNFNRFAAVAGIAACILSLLLLTIPGRVWPWIAVLWMATAAAYICCRIRWVRPDSDIIGAALERFNNAFPLNTNERKIAMHTLEETSSSSVTAALIVALFGGKQSLHYYYGWSESGGKANPDAEKENAKKPAGKKRVKINGIIPLQTNTAAADLQCAQAGGKCIRLDPDKKHTKTS